LWIGFFYVWNKSFAARWKYIHWMRFVKLIHFVNSSESGCFTTLPRANSRSSCLKISRQMQIFVSIPECPVFPIAFKGRAAVEKWDQSETNSFPPSRLHRGCQICIPKNHTFGIYWRALEWKMLVLGCTKSHM
jgi:hypothetical protein